jgi:membrane protein YqaA with SNARE-associated domain
MKARVKKYLIFLGILVFILVWTLIINFTSPEKIVAKMGAQNGYIILFLISAIGGVSSATASSYYLAVSVLAAGGLDPILLGIIGGFGVTIGDSLFFYIGRKGKEVSSEKLNKKTKKIYEWMKKSPKGFIPFFIFLYAGFTPFPNDLMTAPLGFLGYSYKKTLPPLLLGNIMATLLISYFSAYGISALF